MEEARRVQEDRINVEVQRVCGEDETMIEPGTIAEAGEITMPDGHVYRNAVVVVFKSREDCREAVKNGGTFLPFGAGEDKSSRQESRCWSGR